MQLYLKFLEFSDIWVKTFLWGLTNFKSFVTRKVSSDLHTFWDLSRAPGSGLDFVLIEENLSATCQEGMGRGRADSRAASANQVSLTTHLSMQKALQLLSRRL